MKILNLNFKYIFFLFFLAPIYNIHSISPRIAAALKAVVAVKGTAFVSIWPRANGTKAEEKSQLKNVKSGDVRVYHTVEKDVVPGAGLQDIRKHGLMTRNELLRRGLTEQTPSGPLSDQYNVIYFSYDPEHRKDPERTVGFDVNPETTYVANMEFRYDINRPRYNHSHILLSDYIKKRDKAEKLEKSAKPGQAVIHDPYTAEPFYVSVDDTRYYDPQSEQYFDYGSVRLEPRHYMYLNEITIAKPCIPADQLIFPEEDALRVKRTA